MERKRDLQNTKNMNKKASILVEWSSDIRDRLIRSCLRMWINMGKGHRSAKFVSTNGFTDCIRATEAGTGEAANLDKMKAFSETCDRDGNEFNIGRIRCDNGMSKVIRHMLMRCWRQRRLVRSSIFLTIRKNEKIRTYCCSMRPNILNFMDGLKKI